MVQSELSFHLEYRHQDYNPINAPPCIGSVEGSISTLSFHLPYRHQDCNPIIVPICVGRVDSPISALVPAVASPPANQRSSSLCCRADDPIRDARQHGGRAHGAAAVPEVQRAEGRRGPGAAASAEQAVRGRTPVRLEGQLDRHRDSNPVVG